VVTPSAPTAGSLACVVVNTDVGLPLTKGDMSKKSLKKIEIGRECVCVCVCVCVCGGVPMDLSSPVLRLRLDICFCGVGGGDGCEAENR
jgi:hypothetical protein